MTLILTFARPGEGAWQTADGRLTRAGVPFEDYESKQITLSGADGTMLLAYTGVAEITRQRVHTLQWLRAKR